MSHQVFPILVHPLRYDDVKDVLLGTQVAKIDNEIKYNELRDYLTKNITCTNKSSTKWDTERKKFKNSINLLLKSISLPETLSSEEILQLRQELDECKEELRNHEENSASLKGYIKELENLKNSESVNKVKKKSGLKSISEEFKK